MAQRRPRLGIFGGTFDPVHVGHLIVAEELRYRLGLEQVLFLPAGRPPHKSNQEIASNADRVYMLQLAIASNPHFSISLVDLQRPGFSYTADSLEILRRVYPDHEHYFLMGQDSLRDFPNWHQPDRIAQQVTLGVALRPGVEVDVADIERRVPQAAGRIVLVDIPLIQVAAREIRRRVRDNEPILYQVPPPVEAYIRRMGLYRADSATEPNAGPPATARRLSD